MQGAGEPVIVPRPFKLRLEFDAASGKKHATYLTEQHANFINYGLHQMTAQQKEDVNFDVMGFWQGIIIGAQNLHCGEVIYSWVCRIPAQYPMAPPLIRFITKISLPCVDNRGFVNIDKIPNFRWNATMNIADVLMAIRVAMHDSTYTKASHNLIGQNFFQEFPANQIEKNFM